MSFLNDTNTTAIRNIIRGTIRWVNLPEVKGSSIQRGWHPCVILQNNIGNKYSPNAQVCGITSRILKNRLPTNISIEKNDKNGLDKNSIIQVESVTNVPQFLIGDYIGELDERTMKLVDNALQIQFGINKEEKEEIKEIKIEKEEVKIDMFDEAYIKKCMFYMRKNTELYEKYGDIELLQMVMEDMNDVKQYCIKNGRDYTLYIKNIQAETVQSEVAVAI